MKSIYTTVSNAEFYDVLREDAEAGATNWTISKHARRGDKVLLYVCAPVSAIVAVATVATTPERDDNLQSEWWGHYLADMDDLRMLDQPITRHALRERFPDWGYWKQPRNSVRVPEQYSSAVASLTHEVHA